MMEIEVSEYMACDCDDWKHGDTQFNNIFVLAHLHDMRYTGPMFRYCSWCSKPLVDGRGVLDE